MNESLTDKVVRSLQQASFHNSNIMVKPEVILWPDPDKQWQPVVPFLQEQFPALLIFGSYEPDKRQGPAIWLKCMVARMLPEANWEETDTPIIYLPGISKQDLKDITQAGLELQPLMEYQYTGTIWTQENGKEHTIMSFLINEREGLGLTLSKDTDTKDALVQALPRLMNQVEFPEFVDSDFLYSLIFPDAPRYLLSFLDRGEAFMVTLSDQIRDAFRDFCRIQYQFELDPRNKVAIAEKLGRQEGAWKSIWQYYAHAPHKYPGIPDLLRQAKPPDMGLGMFQVAEDSWPQINEEKEKELQNSLQALFRQDQKEWKGQLQKLFKNHSSRLKWIWTELGHSPLVLCLGGLIELIEVTSQGIPAASLSDLNQYYTMIGYKADQTVRRLWVHVKQQTDKDTLRPLLDQIYKLWLEKLSLKLQALLEKGASGLQSSEISWDGIDCILFVDALRWELAQELVAKISSQHVKLKFESRWSALPSLTPTCKPAISPLQNLVSKESPCVEFKPQLKNGKDLSTDVFRKTLSEVGFEYLDLSMPMEPGKRYWKEIGEIDTKGHQEGADMFRRIDEMFDIIVEFLEAAQHAGMRNCKIVTDHGWLMLPGGLPNEKIPKDHTETRWGRCAIIKEGITSELLHLPWHWNSNIYVAFAPGISFFKKNEEYAHGGISMQECLIPEITIEFDHGVREQALIIAHRWVGLTCFVETQTAMDGFAVDIRTKASDSRTSIVLSSDRNVKDNKVRVKVSDDELGRAAFIVLMDENQVILHKTTTTIGG